MVPHSISKQQFSLFEDMFSLINYEQLQRGICCDQSCCVGIAGKSCFCEIEKLNRKVWTKMIMVSPGIYKMAQIH